MITDPEYREAAAGIPEHRQVRGAAAPRSSRESGRGKARLSQEEIPGQATRPSRREILQEPIRFSREQALAPQASLKEAREAAAPQFSRESGRGRL